MWFAASIVTATLITLTSIFAFYNLFLQQSNSQPLPQTTSSNLQTPIDESPQPSAIASPLKSATPSSKPKLSQTNSTAGSLTVLHDNIPSQPPGSSTISGTVYLNGTPPSGTTVVIAAREHGTNNPSKVVISGITAQTGASWSWNSAQSGTTYDMVAVLKGQSNGVDVDYANSPTYNLTAPTKSFIMTLDVGYLLSAPTGAITVTCHTHYSNNTWYATVNFPIVTGALMYKLRVGTASGGSDIIDTTKNAQTQDVTFNDSATYYAQYAVSTVSTPTQVQYSPFSGPYTARCP